MTKKRKTKGSEVFIQAVVSIALVELVVLCVDPEMREVLRPFTWVLALVEIFYAFLLIKNITLWDFLAKQLRRINTLFKKIGVEKKE